jgi:uncharacterized oxidoreductase
MPLADFIDETLRVLGTDADEVLTERVGFLRRGAGPNDAAATHELNMHFISDSR